MPKVAAVTVRIFSIVNPLLFEPHLRRNRIRGVGAAPPDLCTINLQRFPPLPR
jgi:hypothetical protein